MASLSRRELGRAALALGTWAARRAYGRDRTSPDTWSGYSDAVVINGVGGCGAEQSGPPDARLSPSVIDDIRQSGLTAVNVTVGSVGYVLSGSLLKFGPRLKRRHRDRGR